MHLSPLPAGARHGSGDVVIPEFAFAVLSLLNGQIRIIREFPTRGACEAVQQHAEATKPWYALVASCVEVGADGRPVSKLAL